MADRTKMNECWTCVYRREVLGNAHIACGNPDPNMDGEEHGIKNGWFAYPVCFDPVWKLKTCANYDDGTGPKVDPVTHSPGPWRLGKGGKHIEAPIAGHPVCELPQWNEWEHGQDVTPANVSLICAAPDLLLALQVCECELSMGPRTVPVEKAIERARAAIKLALGKGA